MRYKELIDCREEDLPEWIRGAEIENAVIELEDDRVIWHSGTWRFGTWEDGTWKSGVWEFGVWKSGLWESGIWCDGTWKFGRWESGTWNSGIWGWGVWENGTWKAGRWRNGLWENGRWEDGHWENGVWESGTWEGGIRKPHCKWRVYAVDDDRVAIGCQRKTIKEWDKFFAGDEVIETPRGTEEFRLMYANYRACREYSLVLRDGAASGEFGDVTGEWRGSKMRRARRFVFESWSRILSWVARVD